MNRRILVFYMFLCLILPCAALAEKEIGEGYAKPSYIELSQTSVLLGGFNIRDPKVADEYLRLVYCNLYRKNFENDVAWNAIRNKIISRVTEKKEPFRVLYETKGLFTLGRYDFENQAFPLTEDTALKNVGSISLFTLKEAEPVCSTGKISYFFPPNIGVRLNRALTIDKVPVPADKVERILVRIDEASEKRQVYGRIRIRITDPATFKSEVSKSMYAESELKGDVTQVDFFIDKEMTKPISSIALTR